MALKLKEARVLYDVRGRKTHVLLPFKTYERMLEYLEDLDDLRAIREVEHEKTIPWEEAKRILSKKRKR
jgi:hypothetical protein